MKAVVVYESHWGSTATIARAIAEGIGPGTMVLATDEADISVVSGADLLVAGAPVMAFGLPSERMERAIAKGGATSAKAPDVSHPSLRSWLHDLPRGHGAGVAFETRIHRSPGGATGAIERGLGRAGYDVSAPAGKFVVTGQHGPLKQGELDRARRWGAELRSHVAVPER
ncbi:MAG: flavodoxin family protein [Candidatus Limnocylindrales bacterium]